MFLNVDNSAHDVGIVCVKSFEIPFPSCSLAFLRLPIKIDDCTS